MNLFDSFVVNVNKLIFGKVNSRKKAVEAKLMETPAFDTSRLDSLYKEIERLEVKEQELRAETEEILAKARKVKARHNLEQMKKDYLKSGVLPDFSDPDPIVQDALERGFKDFCEDE